MDRRTDSAAAETQRWEVVTYAIDEKATDGEWVKFLPVAEGYANGVVEELRIKYPMREFRLRRMTTIAEVIERV